jgi:2,4-dichlorophenol 6-monooxygenase
LLRKGREISTLDLLGNGRFTVLTGISGGAWAQAATKIASYSGLPIVGRVIGPGADAEDLYGDWSRLRETNEDGCVLVRPDGYVGFRAEHAAGDPKARLEDALSKILSRHTAKSAERHARQPIAVGAK